MGRKLLYGGAAFVLIAALAVAALFPSEEAGHSEPVPGGQSTVFYEHYVVFRVTVATIGVVVALGMFLLGRRMGEGH